MAQIYLYTVIVSSHYTKRKWRVRRTFQKGGWEVKPLTTDKSFKLDPGVGDPSERIERLI